MRGTTRWIALLLALTLVAAACGDDDDGGTFAGGDSDGGTEAFCDLAQQQEDLDASVNGGEINIFEPETFRGAFEELVELTERAADVAPEEIRDDFEILVDGLGDVQSQLEDVDYDLTAINEDDFADTAEQDAAAERIEAFVEEECGIVDSGAELSDEQIEEQLGESGAGGGLIAEAFVEAGLPQDQADCLAERVSFQQLIEFGEAGGTPPAEFFEALDACGVSLEQLTELGAMSGDDLGDMDLGEELGEESVEDLIEDMPEVEAPSTGGVDLPPEAIDLFVSELVNQGFTEEEARCLAGPILEDPANADPLQAFEDCGISLSRLAELGG